MKKIVEKLFILIYRVLFYLVGKLPVQKNLIVFESFLGKQYSDNPRAIYEYMQQNFPNYQLLWSIDRREVNRFKNKEFKMVKRLSFSWLLKMARAKYWVTNSRLPIWLPKPKHTTYLQTWHGTPLKRLAADIKQVHMPGTDTQKYKDEFIKEAKKWDYLISPNAYSTEIFRRAFKFDKTIMETGYPRNDYLINYNNEKEILNLKRKYDLPEDKKIILYAPTWRDNKYYQIGKYKFDLALDLQALRKELQDDYIVLLRMHYLVSDRFHLDEYDGFVFDYSSHGDIRELYLLSDILITDYSSVFFDYAILKRPMIFFVHDIDEYRDKLRGFYFDFEKEAPGGLTNTTEEVIDEIRSVESMSSSDFNKFYKTFTYLEDGNATRRVLSQLLQDN
jgi:CDP-glycerol glycerophosphotransferase